MKFDTKKCSPVSLQCSKNSTKSVGLDHRDFVWRDQNQYITDNDDDNDNENGRLIEHLPRLFYTPVKVSARTKQGTSRDSKSTQRSTRTVNFQEMQDLTSCLMNLRFGDKNEVAQGQAESGVEKSSSSTITTKGSSPLLGRTSQEHVDPKTGKSTTVWRSSRVSKKIDRL